ncbi:hypothetical protein [Streptomyces cellulosae]|uniref:hypothetical protein n=1 Tax=Streptomyces cellulosae TaxID=1968 RepID=UPI000B2AE05A|nr:hypothetical protein [Streptomyces cellulosae]
MATGHLVSADDIRKILHGEMRGTWEQVAALIRALDGEPDFFRPHFDDAQQTTPAQPVQLTDTPTHRLNRILSAFGDTLHDARTVAPSASLAVRRRELRRRLAHAAPPSAQGRPTG